MTIGWDEMKRLEREAAKRLLGSTEKYDALVAKLMNLKQWPAPTWDRWFSRFKKDLCHK